jgi:transposase
LRLKDGESMSSLCREFGISRVTGYKIYERYKECGLEGLTDRAWQSATAVCNFPFPVQNQ